VKGGQTPINAVPFYQNGGLASTPDRLEFAAPLAKAFRGQFEFIRENIPLRNFSRIGPETQPDQVRSADHFGLRRLGAGCVAVRYARRIETHAVAGPEKYSGLLNVKVYRAIGPQRSFESAPVAVVP
jgi:hypothetical protein